VPDLLLDAVTEVATRDGYAHLTVEKILVHAGVSRASFYQYFCNVGDCFWSAYRQHAGQFASDITAAARGSQHRELGVLDALVDTAISRPKIALLLMREGLAAGTTGLTERDALISVIQKAMAFPAMQQSVIDLPASILIGGIFRFLSMRLSDDGPFGDVSEEVQEWLRAFLRRSPQLSWSARFAPALPCGKSRPAPLSRKTRPQGTPRERILRATAATIREKSYHDITVTDIVRAAGVSRRSFYNELPCKSSAFIAAYEHAFEQTMAACAPAFFSSAVWPERVWDSALAFTRFLAREPCFAHLGFVECYAIGPGFVPRVHDTQLAFTLFLEEGYRQRVEAQWLSRASSALTAAAIFEAGFQGTRYCPGQYFRLLQPLAVYIALAPFVGLDEGGKFVLGKLTAQASRAPAMV
jgi:AcrR family transcriptional regulator